ncbi:MAG: hypothetical protein DHS20C18_01510 [Saprospiraceae bacterium]|nr:MAG: hypothetical protein DHS20C18_01510 [Saprospiraceae bacterium]
MRETNFIEQNKEKWSEFEQTLDRERKDPEKLNDLFVQITDDLSYSRTFYPNRSVRVYLNGLAQRVFFSIYKNRPSRLGRIFSFWTDELPQLIYESRYAFRISFFCFVLSVAIGVLSCAMDPDFAEVILGESYIDMTIENINSGDPMAVYKDRGAFGMSLGITMNNLWVSLLIFVLGAFFGIGAVVVIIQNGIMVGAFQYFFIQQGLFQESFLTIWVHGTLEMSAMVIAGAAGITMGRGLVFPGTYSRLQAFQRSARRGIKIMVGIAPIIITAGFIEGYLTRHTETPDIIRGLFIFLCLAFILIYFVWYPSYKARHGFNQPLRETKLQPDKNQEIGWHRIKSSGEIFAEIFSFYRKYLSQVALAALLAAILFSTASLFLTDQSAGEVFTYPNRIFGTLSVISQFFISEKMVLIPCLMALGLGIVGYAVYGIIMKEEGVQPVTPLARFSLLGKSVLGGVLLELILMTNDWYTMLIFLLFPLIMLWTYTSIREGRNSFVSLSRTTLLVSGNLSRIYGLFLLLLVTGILFFSLTDTLLVQFFFALVGWIVNFDQDTMDQLSIILLTYLNTFVFFFLMTMFMLGFGLLYYALLEINAAPNLLDQIRQIGPERRIRGLQKE